MHSQWPPRLGLAAARATKVRAIRHPRRAAVERQLYPAWCPGRSRRPLLRLAMLNLRTSTKDACGLPSEVETPNFEPVCAPAFWAP
jgi:hypothetical protein